MSTPKKLDSKGRICLGKEYANATVLVDTGIRQARAGKVVKGPLDKTKASWIDDLDDRCSTLCSEPNPRGHRIFWCYGLANRQITILAITPHP